MIKKFNRFKLNEQKDVLSIEEYNSSNLRDEHIDKTITKILDHLDLSNSGIDMLVNPKDECIYFNFINPKNIDWEAVYFVIYTLKNLKLKYENLKNSLVVTIK